MRGNRSTETEKYDTSTFNYGTGIAHGTSTNGDNFHLESGDDLLNGDPLSWLGLPTPFDCLPQTIGKLRMSGASRPAPFPHGDDGRNLSLIGEWKLSGKHLVVKSSFSGSSETSCES